MIKSKENFYVRVFDRYGKPVSTMRDDRFMADLRQILRNYQSIRVELATENKSPKIPHPVCPFRKPPVFLSAETQRRTQENEKDSVVVKLSVPITLSDGTEYTPILSVSLSDFQNFKSLLRGELRKHIPLDTNAVSSYDYWFESYVSLVFRAKVEELLLRE